MKSFTDIDDYLDFDIKKLADYHVRYHETQKRALHDARILSSENSKIANSEMAKKLEQKKLK